MKEIIEKKLGMTIEEYLQLSDEIERKYEDVEYDWDDPLSKLSLEELEFFESYVNGLEKAS